LELYIYFNHQANFLVLIHLEIFKYSYFLNTILLHHFYWKHSLMNLL